MIAGIRHRSRANLLPPLVFPRRVEHAFDVAVGLAQDFWPSLNVLGQQAFHFRTGHLLLKLRPKKARALSDRVAYVRL
jgi:hypothetical protein